MWNYILKSLRFSGPQEAEGEGVPSMPQILNLFLILSLKI